MDETDHACADVEKPGERRPEQGRFLLGKTPAPMPKGCVANETALAISR
jgi:hypothetical protein